MSISKKQRIKPLNEQIDLHQYIVMKYFQDSEIEKLEFYKEEKLWIFHLNIKNVLPLDVYQVLLGHLKESFKGIANVNIKLICEDNTCMDDIIIDNWIGFKRSKNDLSPAYIDFIHIQKLLI